VSALQRNLVVLVAAIAFAMVGFGTASALADTPPSITDSTNAIGSPQVGDTLTEVPAQWTLPPQTTSIVWLACDSAGQNCNPIAGAPITEGSSYQVQRSVAGSTVEVADTANYPLGSTTTLNSAPTGLIGPSPTTTSLTSVPSVPITNQPTTLYATVASSTGLAPPEGTVSFQVAGQPISGCSAVAVQTFSQSAQVTCQSVFSAANSPEALTAVFTPSAGSGVAPSTSPTYSMGVGIDSTTTKLDVSHPIVNAGTNGTYTATVKPSLSGIFEPTGKVLFLDYGNPIPQCPATPLHFAHGVATAQCVVHYVGVGSHSITAFYLGGGGFGGSATTPQTVTVKRLPPKIRGTIKATMSWTFRFFPTYTQVLSFLLRKPGLGTVVLLTCHGSFCPFAHRSITVKKMHVCVVTPVNSSCVLQLPPSVNLATPFGKSKLHVGDVLTIELTRPFWIGKGYVFTIRAGKGPKYHIGCLAPGSTKIGVGCLTPESKKKKTS
jgi:hypothetical protein